jgi:hypothetical protein
MKNTILNRLYFLILLSSLCGMVAFCLGADAETEAGKFNALLLMGLAEIIIVLSIIILYFTKSTKN